MSISLNTNVGSLTAQRFLNNTGKAMGKTFERLSSGLRINRAADDSGGLSIGTRMTSQIRGMSQAMRNANDGISLVQVAEGALEETTNALQRMRELAVQASNTTLTSSDRDDLNLEFAHLISEVERISDDTQYNGKTLLDGTFSSKLIQVGAYSGQTISITFKNANTSAIGVATLTLSGSVGTAAMSAISKVDNAIASISDIRANLGSIQNRFEAVIGNLANMVENTTASRSRIMDADIAQETSALTKNAILQQAGTAILAQANQQPQLALSLLG